MIRAFVTTWSGVAGGSVTNPIQDYIDQRDLGIPVVCSMYYADADADGLPDGPLVLVLVQQIGEAKSETIESFADIPGVYMLPPSKLSAPVSNAAEIRKRLRAFGVPASVLSGDTYGDLLKSVARHINPRCTGFGRVEVESESEFE